MSLQGVWRPGRQMITSLPWLNWDLEERSRFERMGETIWALVMSLKCLWGNLVEFCSTANHTHSQFREESGLERLTWCTQEEVESIARTWNFQEIMNQESLGWSQDLGPRLLKTVRPGSVLLSSFLAEAEDSRPHGNVHYTALKEELWTGVKVKLMAIERVGRLWGFQRVPVSLWLRPRSKVRELDTNTCNHFEVSSPTAEKFVCSPMVWGSENGRFLFTRGWSELIWKRP